MDFLLNHWEVGLAALLTLATIITRATKSPKDDQALASVKRVLGRLSILDHHDSGRMVKAPLTRASEQTHPDDQMPPPPESSSR
jgi:hypothetical protein